MDPFTTNDGSAFTSAPPWQAASARSNGSARFDKGTPPTPGDTNRGCAAHHVPYSTLRTLQEPRRASNERRGGGCRKTSPRTRAFGAGAAWYAAAMRNLLAVAALMLAFLLGAGLAWHFAHREPRLPDTPALILKVREVARLETLDVSLYKKIDFSPDPREQATVWASLAQWASYTLRPPRGRAIVFAVAHLGLDLRKLDAQSLRVAGRRVEVGLPPGQTQGELRPAEGEIIGSKLNSGQTAPLF